MRAALAYVGILAFAGIGSAWHGRIDGLTLLILIVCGAAVFALVALAANQDEQP